MGLGRVRNRRGLLSLTVSAHVPANAPMQDIAPCLIDHSQRAPCLESTHFVQRTGLVPAEAAPIVASVTTNYHKEWMRPAPPRVSLAMTPGTASLDSQAFAIRPRFGQGILGPQAPDYFCRSASTAARSFPGLRHGVMSGDLVCGGWSEAYPQEPLGRPGLGGAQRHHRRRLCSDPACRLPSHASLSGTGDQENRRASGERDETPPSSPHGTGDRLCPGC